MISIIMTNWNKAKYIEPAIMSLETQTVKPKELLFIDDASDDNSLDIIKNIKRKVSFPIKIFETYISFTENICLPANIGFKMSTQPILVINPSDIMHLNPKNLETIIDHHTRNRNLILTPKLFRKDKIQRISIAGMSVRREYIFKIKGYDERMHGWGGNDTDLLARLTMIGLKHVICEEIIVKHMEHPYDKRRPFNKDNDYIHAENIRNNTYAPNNKWGVHPLLEEIT